MGRPAQGRGPVAPRPQHLFLLPRRPLRCRWRPKTAPANMRSTRSPTAATWASGTAWRWGHLQLQVRLQRGGWSPAAGAAAGGTYVCGLCECSPTSTGHPVRGGAEGESQAGTRTCAGGGGKLLLQRGAAVLQPVLHCLRSGCENLGPFCGCGRLLRQEQRCLLKVGAPQAHWLLLSKACLLL